MDWTLLYDITDSIIPQILFGIQESSEEREYLWQGKSMESKDQMKRYKGTRYNTLMDSSAWTLLLVAVAGCITPVLIVQEWWMILIMLAMIVFIILTFAGIYYKIDGDNLIVYQFFIPKAYPISKMKEIKPTKSILSSPATSLSHRMAIKFTDRSVMKSYMPLIISPARQTEFITQLISINPSIEH